MPWSVRNLSLMLVAGAVLAPGRPSTAGEEPDLSRVDRRLSKEPAYRAAQPLYGLYVFGPRAETRVWAVLDKSGSESEHFDVLYFDRNADGDLTGGDERIAGKIDGDSVTFDIGTFTDPRTKQEHTGVTVLRVGGENPYTMILMKWCGKVAVRGGCAAREGPQTMFATSAKDAPVIWPGADAPFRFQPWMLEPLRVGEENDFRVFMGHAGHGPNTFAAVHNTFLPTEVPVLATLIYNRRGGEECQARSELRHLSCGVLRCGVVHVPADAVPGKAKLRVELPESSKLASIPTEIPIVVVAKKSGK